MKMIAAVRQYYSIKETAEILGVKYLCVMKMCQRGDIESRKIGGRRFIPRAQIDIQVKEPKS